MTSFFELPLMVISPLSAVGLWTWVGALLTLAIFSFLWRDNPVYRFAEHLFVGVSMGYFLVLVWTTSTYPDLVLPLFSGHEKSAHDPDISIRDGGRMVFTAQDWNRDRTVVLGAEPDADRENGTAEIEVRMTRGANRIGAVRVEAVEIDTDAEPSEIPAGAETLPVQPKDDALRFVLDRTTVPIKEGGTAEFRVRLSRAPAAPVHAVAARADAVSTANRLLLLIPLVLGLMLVSRIVPRISWMSRITIGLLVGMGAGAAIPVVMKARILTQTSRTMSLSLLVMENGQFDAMGTFNNLVLIVGIITSLIYFWFSIEHKGPVGVAAKTGIYFLMVGFGAAFGYTVMARVSLLIGRVLFLLDNWLQVV